MPLSRIEIINLLNAGIKHPGIKGSPLDAADLTEEQTTYRTIILELFDQIDALVGTVAVPIVDTGGVDLGIVGSIEIVKDGSNYALQFKNENGDVTSV